MQTPHNCFVTADEVSALDDQGRDLYEVGTSVLVFYVDVACTLVLRGVGLLHTLESELD